MDVGKDSKFWTIEKRQKEFDKLQEKIAKKCPNLAKLPEKSWLKVSKDEDLEKRKNALQEWLNKCSQREDVVVTDEFKEFCNLSENTTDLNVTKPSQCGKLDLDSDQSLDQFECLFDQKMLFVSSNKIDVTGKLANYVNKKKDEEEDISEVGSSSFIECYTFVEMANEYVFMRRWRKGYKWHHRCISYEINSNFLAIGLSSGYIDTLKVKKEADAHEQSDHQLVKTHSEKVMGVVLVKNMLQVAGGQELRWIDVDTKTMNEFKLSLGHVFSATCMVQQASGNRLVVGTNNGSIVTVGLSAEQPTVLNTFTDPTNACHINEIKLLDKQVGAGQSDGKILVQFIDPQKTEQMVRVNAVQDCHNSVGALEQDRKNGEIFAGSENGLMHVYKASNGNLIANFKLCKKKISQFHFVPEDRLLFIADHRGQLQVNQLPENWRDREAVERENTDHILKKAETLNLKSMMTKTDDDSDDELNNWHK